MNKIARLAQLIDEVKRKDKKKIAVALAEDSNTLEAIKLAVEKKIVFPVLIGNQEKIEILLHKQSIDPIDVEIVHEPDDFLAAKKAVSLVKNSDADVLMKGLVSTDKYLKAVLDKESGLLPPKNILSHITVVEIPSYHKLLFLTDIAVIPFPDIAQKKQMINYAIKVCNSFGISKPKVSLLSATEKVNPKFSSTIDAALLSKMSDRNEISSAIVDGPLDLFISCDPVSMDIKGVSTPIGGEADVLVFPNIEAGNIFYKGLMLFAKGELAALLQGTEKPVVLTSRSEGTLSKFYSIAFGCLMAQ